MKKLICLIALALQTAAAAAQWVQQSSPTPDKLNDVYAISVDTVIAVGDSGTIIRTIDGGINWNMVTSGVTDPITSVHFPDNNGYAVTASGVVIKSTDNGASWFGLSTLPINPAFGIHFADPASGYTCGSATGGERVMKTADGGASWFNVGFGLNNPLFSIFSISPTAAFTVGISGNIYKTIDEGASWVSQASGTTKNLRSVYFADPNHGYAVGDTGIFVKTNDGGNNWTNMQATPVNLKGVFFMDTINGWVAGGNGVILKTGDGGSTWFQESTPTTDPLNAVFFRGGAGYAVGLNGTILKLPPPPPPCQAKFSFTISSLTASFTDSSTTANPPIMSWSWDFGDGIGTSTVTNPSYTYASGGTYNVCLSITDNVGCSNTYCQSVTVSGGACMAEFTYTASSLTASFTDGSTTTNPPITSWSWNFNGDSIIDANVPNPTWTYLAPGTYNVCLTITDSSGCNNTICKSVTVSGGGCIANFSYTADTGTYTAYFTDGSTTSSGTISSWSWDFGDGNTSTAQSPSHTYTIPITDPYNVCLTITDTAGCTDSFCQSVCVSGGCPPPHCNNGIMDYDETGIDCGGADCVPCGGGCTANFGFTTSSLTASFTDSSTTPNPPMSWSWNFNGDSITDATNPNPTWTYPAPGTYNVCLTITDNVGCSNTVCKTVTVTSGGGCTANFGFTTSSLTASFTDSSTTSYPPLQWEWNFNGDSIIDATNPNPTWTFPASGTYNVCLTIKDSSGCINTICKTVSVTSGGSCVANFGFTTSSLTANFTDSSTTPNPPIMSWSWNFGDSTTSTVQNPSHTYISGGTYNVCLTITDMISCTNTICKTVAVSGGGCIANISSFLNASCFGVCNGQATVAVSGGTSPYTFSWNTTPVQNATMATGLCAGTYTVIITDFGGFTCTASVPISQPPAITTAMQVTNLNCNGVCDGTATVSIVSGGIPPFAYSWSTSPVQTTATATGLCAGPASNYIVTITDANGCTTGTGTLPISEPPLLTVNITGSDETCIGCCDGSAAANVTGGVGAYTYSWNTSPVQTTATAAGLCAGSYIVNVTDSNGCSATNTVTIGSPACNITASIVGTDVSCSGNCDGAANLIVSNGTAPYAYSWSNAAVTEDLTNLCAGVYTVTVTDAVSCTATGSVTISASNTLTAVITGVTPAPCLEICDGIASAFATGGVQPYTYLWDDPSAQTNSIANNLCAGTYTVMVTDAAGCSDTAGATVISNPEIILAVNTVNSTCGNADGSATVTVSNGTSPYDYQWSTGDTLSFADSLASGFYIVTVTDAVGCSNFSNVTISDANGPVITGTSVTGVTCNGGSDGAIIIGVGGGTAPYTYQWSNGSTTQNISNLVAGPYELTVTDAAGCVLTQSITVTQPDAISLTISKQDATCGNTDGSATVNVSGGTGVYAYAWSTGGTGSTESGLGAGIYYVTVTDANGCVDSAAVAVSNEGGPIITVDSIVDITCDNPSGGSIYITVTGGDEPYNYLWSNNDVTEDIVNVPGGNYNITVTDAAGCLATASMIISGISPAGDSICVVTVDSATGKNLIVWEKTMGGNIQSYNIYKESTQAGVYYLIGTQEFNVLSVFTDSLSDPAIRSWRYKISSVDSCGNESALSKRHKTMHLTINQGLNNTVNLIWDHYQGFDFGSYYIHRYTTSTGWVEVDSMPNTLTSWTDPSPPGGNIYYRVVVKHPDGCQANKKADDYNSSRSNTSIAVTETGIRGEFGAGSLEFRVYPNPSASGGVLTVEIYDGSDYDLRVYDVLGREIFKSQIVNRTSYIDLRGYPTGIYHLQLVSDKGIANMKVVIE